MRDKPVGLKVKLLFSLLLAALLTQNAVHADTFENHFASIYVGKKKIGQVHFTATHNSEGVLQELQTSTSYSIFGVELYHHTLDVHEFWKEGEIQTLSVKSNDNNDLYDAELVREPNEYVGQLNGKAIALPLEAFPVAVWHYAITENPLLFNLPDLELYHVEVKKSSGRVKLGGHRIPAEKFEFSGDWEATVWFDEKQRFLKWTYEVLGIEIDVVLDSLPD